MDIININMRNIGRKNIIISRTNHSVDDVNPLIESGSKITKLGKAEPHPVCIREH